MKTKFKLISGAVAGAMCLVAGSVHAATIISLTSDTGSLKEQSYVPPAITSVTLTNPYGAPPLPTIVPVANGFALSFVVTSDFLASASSSTGGKTATMDGKLQFTITLDTAQHLTANLFEDGIFAKTGGGTVDVSGSLTVTGTDPVLLPQTVVTTFPAETYNPSGMWSLRTQATGFVNNYKTYTISVDNSLLAEALATNGAGTAYLAKKDFTLLFTFDGSGAGAPTPEPASLGVLALGGVALLARRRK